MNSTPPSYLVRLFLLVLTLNLTVQSGCDNQPSSSASGEAAQKRICGKTDLEEEACRAYWRKTLRSYPDLPAKIQQILDEKDNPEEGRVFRDEHADSAELRIYSNGTEQTFKGKSIDVLVTDFDEASLRRVLATIKEVQESAQVSGAKVGDADSPPPGTYRIVVLGSDAEARILGPDGDDARQVVKLYQSDLSSVDRVTIHAFGPTGQHALQSTFLRSVVPQKFSRWLARTRAKKPADSDDEPQKSRVELPDETVTLLVAGNLKLRVDGAARGGKQTVHAYINSQRGVYHDNNSIFHVLRLLERHQKYRKGPENPEPPAAQTPHKTPKIPKVK